MSHYFIPGAVVLVVLLLATACAPNQAYRTSANAFTGSAKQAEDPTNHAFIETTPEYTLGFVEFDEEGWFWDKSRVNQIEDLIRKEASVGVTNHAAGVVMLVFVHGWKNNASPACGNVVTFRAALQQLKASEDAQAKEHNRPSRRIVGIYCGWRGLSSTMEPFKELSFWNRKSTAHKVGGYSAMTQLLVELEEIQDASNHTLSTDGIRTEYIIVGHSFGGGAVYSAISEFITERFVENVEHTPQHALKPLGDQVILLNPAFEASRHYNLNRLATTVAKYPDSQRPVLSIFTSRGDWATHYALPAGRFLATMFEKFRDPDQRHATREAVGWFAPFVTHSLDFDTNSVLGATAPAPKKKIEPDKTPDTAHLQRSVQNVHAQRMKWIPNNPQGPQTYNFDQCILKPRSTFKPGDPFLVVAVDKKIMKDHDDIDNPVLVNFLREYIQFCHPDAPAPAKPK